MDTDNSQPKRGRGRPRKNQASSDKKKKQNNILKSLDEKITDEIVLHLPISQADLENSEPNPEPGLANPENSHVFTINDIHNESTSSSDNFENSSNSIKKIKSENKNLLKTIKKLEGEITQYKNLLTENNPDYNPSVRVQKLDLNLIDIFNNKPTPLEKTTIACWWCAHNFDTVPCFIPEKIIDDKFYVFGCFCSFNCAASYNLNMADYKVWNRYSLLKKLYSKIYNTGDQVIELAPPREIFQKFGGKLSWDQYRANSKKTLKEYRLIMPPMISIIPIIEEINTNQKKPNFDINKRNLILKRSKPLPNSNNILLESLNKK